MNKILSIIVGSVAATLAIVYFLPVSQNADFNVGTMVAEAAQVRIVDGKAYCIMPGETEEQFCGCTKEARICNDSRRTIQGRVAPSCEFAPPCQTGSGGGNGGEPGGPGPGGGCPSGETRNTRSECVPVCRVQQCGGKWPTNKLTLRGATSCVAGESEINLTWRLTSSDQNAAQNPTATVARCIGPRCYPFSSMGIATQRSPYDDTDVTPGRTYGYRLYISGPGGSMTTAQTTYVTAPTCTPTGDITADLEIMRPDTNPGAWSDDDINDLGLTEEVQLRWTSTGAVQCQGIAFVTNGATNGTQNNVTEPAAGDTTRYTVICENTEGQRASDSIDVTRIDGEGDGPSITADPGSVDTGDDTDLIWNVGSCLPEETTITASAGGTGLPDSYAAALSSSNGTDTVTITETTTFTISCPAGSADVTVRAIPQIYES